MIEAKKIISDPILKQGLINLMMQANNVIMKIYRSSDKDVKLKSNNTPVTEADLAANTLLTNGLDKLFPNIPVVSEENDSSLSIPKNNNIFWLIDPLDGTKEFINKNKEFTCNLALIENNVSTLGFVSLPAKKLIYYGGYKLGSECLDENQKIKKIKYSSKPNVTRIIASKSHLNESTKKFIDTIPPPIEILQAGSSLKFIKIAEGLADIYPRLGPTSEWDTAAAHAVLEGAGGEVKKLNGEKIEYGKENILNPYFIAKGITQNPF